MDVSGVEMMVGVLRDQDAALESLVSFLADLGTLMGALEHGHKVPARLWHDRRAEVKHLLNLLERHRAQMKELEAVLINIVSDL